MTKTKRYHIRVTGKVQGVFFRKSTAEKAKELGLAGFVRNEDDGSVYAEAEGTPAALEELLEWARYGPAGASVEAVDFEEHAPQGSEKFEVRH